MTLLWTLVRKELLQGMLTFRFTAALLVMVPLWAFSLWVFAHDYQERVARSERSRQVQKQEWKRIAHPHMARYFGMNYTVSPRPLSIFARGMEEEMTGTWRFAGETTPMPYRGVTRVGTGPFYENPARAFFPAPDPQTIIRLVGSLLALLFTYDALTREREQGTLALCGVQPVPRDVLLLGKVVGAWCLLVLACLVAGIGALAVVLPVTGMGFTGEEWLRLGMLTGISGLYLLAFCGIGLALSAWCRETGAALLSALSVWVLLVLFGAGLARVVGEQVRPAISSARMEVHKTRMAVGEHERIRKENPIRFNDQNWGEQSRKMVQTRNEVRDRAEGELQRTFARLDRDYQLDLDRQEGLVRHLARWSPANHFLHLIQGLSGTGGKEVQRFRQTLSAHQGRMDAYWREKARALGWEGLGGDWEDAPLLVLPAWSWGQWLMDGVVDLTLLVSWSVVAFVAAFWGFRRMPLIPG